MAEVSADFGLEDVDDAAVVAEEISLEDEFLFGFVVTDELRAVADSALVDLLCTEGNVGDETSAHKPCRI